MRKGCQMQNLVFAVDNIMLKIKKWHPLWQGDAISYDADFLC